jgi:hypothetical protein
MDLVLWVKIFAFGVKDNTFAFKLQVNTKAKTFLGSKNLSPLPCARGPQGSSNMRFLDGYTMLAGNVDDNLSILFLLHLDA